MTITPEGPARILTTDELARELKVSRRHVTNLTSKGILPSIKLGRAWRYDLAAVLAALGQPLPKEST